MSKGAPLYKRVHFRRIREVFTEIGNYEGLDPNDYDLTNMRVYETYGENLKGKNVSYNVDDGSSCFVLDNRYEFYEAPSISNNPGSPYGKFLFLAYNTSFDYYLFGVMTVKLDANESRRTMDLVETVYFKNQGKYMITFQKNDNYIKKVENGNKFAPGLRSTDHNFDFDSYNSRKKAYKTNRHKILESIGVKNLVSNKKIAGKDPVAIYKKPQNKQQKPGFFKSKPKVK